VIPLARAAATRDALLALGQPVEWHEYSMAHSVCAGEVDDLTVWLKKVLAPSA
jgi:phospholipase/carboxylesterase